MKKIGYLLLSILLIVMFWKFDFNSFIISVKKVPPLAFVALLLLQVLSQLLINYQWCRIGKIMGGANNFFKMLYINARGAIIESITPGVKIGGEVTRALLLKNELKYSPQEAATLVTIQKMLSFSSFLLINLFAFAHMSRQIERLQGVEIKVMIYFFLITLISVLVLFFTCTSLMEKKISKITPKNRWSDALQRYMIILLSNIKVLKKMRGELLKQFLLSLIIWVLFPIKMILLVHLFTTNYDPIFLIEITFISYLVGMIPLLPGGIGGFEVTMTGLLIVMQIQGSEALAITFLFRFITFWFVILISLLYACIWKIGEKKNEILKIKIFT
jgi:uncharacterized protein (TIRG00374 family)